MLQAVKTVRPAFDDFYNSLNSEQKARLDGTGPPLGPEILALERTVMMVGGR